MAPRLRWIIVIIAALMVVIALIATGYILNWDWLGLHGYNKVTITTDFSSSPPKITRTEEYQPGKSLWDWLQLLIIPAVLAVGGYVFTYTTSRNDRAATEKRTQAERDIALDNQREAALQAYIDSMSELLLEKKLRESQPEHEVRKIARVRTLTVLPRLDGSRKGSVLQFLYESNLIGKDNGVVDTSGADLSGADLSGADLSGVNLENANLNRADLTVANLENANLAGALQLHFLGDSVL